MDRVPKGFPHSHFNYLPVLIPRGQVQTPPEYNSMHIASENLSERILQVPITTHCTKAILDQRENLNPTPYQFYPFL